VNTERTQSCLPASCCPLAGFTNESPNEIDGLCYPIWPVSPVLPADRNEQGMAQTARHRIWNPFDQQRKKDVPTEWDWLILSIDRTHVPNCQHIKSAKSTYNKPPTGKGGPTTTCLPIPRDLDPPFNQYRTAKHTTRGLANKQTRATTEPPHDNRTILQRTC